MARTRQWRERSSEEVEPVGDWSELFLFHFLFYCFAQLHAFLTHHCCVLLLVRIDVREELRDLVRILAGRRHLDASCPVEVKVAQRVGKPLNVELLQA